MVNSETTNVLGKQILLTPDEKSLLNIMKHYLDPQFQKIHSRLDVIDSRLDVIDSRLERLEQEMRGGESDISKRGIYT